MVYITSDIHGDYARYKALLNRISLTNTDCLVILGDVVDRGEKGIEILLDIMKQKNVILLMGNHEAMMLEVLETFSSEITDESIGNINTNDFEGFISWTVENGGQPTLEAFHKLSKEKRKEVLDFIATLPSYEEFEINRQDYVLVHAGLGKDFSPDKLIDDYYDEDLLWSRTDYSKIYYPDKILVTGHTPTRNIPGNPKPDFIFKGNNHIAVDCGCGFDGGQLGCICLNTMEEYYI